MLGIKTKIVKTVKQTINTIKKGRLSDAVSIRYLMEYFRADENGHKASIKNADLGYGWIHYGMIRNLKPKRILCIGSRHGFIPAILAQACKDNNFGCVDFVDAGYGTEDNNNWTGVGYWKTAQGKSSFKNFGFEKKLKLYVMTTNQFAKEHKNTYQYIYVDGNHSYQGVTTDYKLFWPRLERGGFMVFHDINVVGKKVEGEYGVSRFWKNIRKRNAISFFYKNSGLGLLQKT